MKNWKMALKMTFGFGIIILLLLITVFWAISGITTIVGDAEIIISGNKLDSQLAQREVEHLNWAGDINSLLTDSEVTVLNVQLDDHECAFGKWLFGEEREEAEALVPSLAPMFNEIEESHRRLHQSAAKIKGSFVQADATIPSLLKQREIEHLQWAARIRDALLAGERSLSVETDPSRCNLGIWFSSETARDMYRNGSVEFNAVWDEMLIQHENLHQSAAILSEIMAEDPVAALDYFNTTTLSYLDNTLAYLNRLTESAENDVEKMKHATEIYTRETQPALKDVQETLHAIRDEARLNIMTDEQMLKAAVDTRMAVILIGAVALLAGIVFAIIITRGITVPLRKGILLAGNLSEGDLTADIDLQQRDELGQLAESLVTMKESLKRVVTDVLLGSDNVLSGSRQLSATAQQLAQGAAEQAASTEEVSSSMEEMDSSINLNADNAAQAEVIARDAVSIVGDGSESVNETVAAMKQIAEKISIIEEIARQTNMLSLNAAIEAARAGEHGKGFAVVAAEVGKLSSQSKIAANEISEIADSSVSLADKTGELIGSIVPKISQTADFIQEINAASNEQKTGAYQITRAITQLDQVVQQNASASEESAAMAEELSSQAEKLKQLVSFFKIDSDINILKKRRINETDADISAQSEFLISKPKKQFLPEPEALSEEMTGVGLRGEGASKSSFDNDFEEF